MRSLGSVIGMALLSLAIFFGAVVVGKDIRDRNHNDTITVTGSAKQRITSDYVIWDGSVGVRGDTQQEAAKTLATWTQEVKTFLGDQGVQDDEITFDPVSAEVHQTSRGVITGYTLRRPFQVRSGRVSAIAQAVAATSKLLEKGIGITSDPLQYVYTKLASLRPQLLAAATKDALGRAKTIVDVTGSHLGGLRGVDVGVFQITSPNSTQVEDYGVYDTSTLEKDVTAVVNVTFAVG